MSVVLETLQVIGRDNPLPAKNFQSQTSLRLPAFIMAHKARVLTVLKELHRVRREVFEGDNHALQETKQRIRDEFRKNISETDPAKVEEALVIASDVVKLMQTSVVQMRQRDDGTFELKLRKSTILPENIPYDPFLEVPLKPERKKCFEISDSPSA